jgi:hypothetical protein
MLKQSDGGIAQVEEHLPSKCKALSSNSSTFKKERNGRSVRDGYEKGWVETFRIHGTYKRVLLNRSHSILSKGNKMLIL